MKRLSIKLRVTLWYALLMLLIVALVLGIMLALSNSAVESGTKAYLTAVVDENADEVEIDDGELEIDEDFLPFVDGVYSSVYTAQGAFIHGQLPARLAEEPPFMDGSVRRVEEGGRAYYVYDRQLAADEGGLWVRGYAAVDAGAGVVDSLVRFACIALPLLALLAALGGYWIADRSFRPIERIRAAAAEIGEGRDLSRRIDLGPGDDEIHRLAGTFDEMFERLEASFEAEKQFTADASHELRTPTSVILAQCEYALAHAQSEEEYREALAVIERQAGKMAQLIAQLLAFSRMERGIEPVHLELENVSDLVRTTCAEQAQATGGARLHADVQPNVYARLDAALFARLLENLISNAAKYGGGNVWVRLRQCGGEAVLSVQDDGIGIAAEHQRKIWQRFYQVDGARSAGDGGMGLGLAMVRQIAALHGGRMTLDSEVGRGSSFSFIFPAENEPL